jgi:hypothetical protein
MPLQIDAVLTSQRPRAVCIHCLAATTERDEGDVRQAVMTLVMERRADTLLAECTNCGATAYVVRRR